MNSGLYALAGASATATAAACAKRFEEPMTNASKWYLGLTRDSAGITALSVCWGRGPIGSSSKTGSADSGWLLGGAAAGAAEEIAELVFACGAGETLGATVTPTRSGLPLLWAREERIDARQRVRRKSLVIPLGT